MSSFDSIDEDLFGDLLTRLQPDLPEVFLEVVSASKGFIELQGFRQVFFLFLVGIKILGIFQKEPPGSFQDNFLETFLVSRYRSLRRSDSLSLNSLMT